MGKRIWAIMMRLCRRCTGAAFKLCGKELTDGKWAVLEQFIKFTCVGCSNSVVLLLVYYAVILILGRDAYLLGQTLGYILGIVNSYFWNSRFVFVERKTRTWSAFGKMCVCYVISYMVQVGILYVGVKRMCFSEMIVPVIAILITTPLNFVLNKSFAFR